MLRGAVSAVCSVALFVPGWFPACPRRGDAGPVRRVPANPLLRDRPHRVGVRPSHRVPGDERLGQRLGRPPDAGLQLRDHRPGHAGLCGRAGHRPAVPFTGPPQGRHSVRVAATVRDPGPPRRIVGPPRAHLIHATFSRSVSRCPRVRRTGAAALGVRCPRLCRSGPVALGPGLFVEAPETGPLPFEASWPGRSRPRPGCGHAGPAQYRGLAESPPSVLHSLGLPARP